MNIEPMKRDVHWKFWPRRKSMSLFPFSIGTSIIMVLFTLLGIRRGNLSYPIYPIEIIIFVTVVGFSILLSTLVYHTQLKYYKDTNITRMTRQYIRTREDVEAIYYRLIESMESTYRNNSIPYQKKEERKVSKTAPFITLLSIQPENIETRVVLTKYYYEVTVKTSSEEEKQYFDSFLKRLIEETVIRFTKDNNLDIFDGKRRWV